MKNIFKLLLVYLVFVSVCVVAEEHKTPEEFCVEPQDEADLKEKLLYFKSPIGKGLIGKNKGDLVEISTPAGVKNFEIIDVKYI